MKPEAYFPFRLAVLDADEHPPLAPLNNRGIETLGYISLGEAASGRTWFADVKADGLLLDENVNWPGSYFVDVRNRRWTDRVLDDFVPAIMAQGFDGLFLDTLDNPPHLEREDPKRHSGMTRAAAGLVQAMRRRFPDIPIMLNRAFELHADLLPIMDYLLGETTLTESAGKPGNWRMIDAVRHGEYVARLKQAQRINPRLTVMTLDYWPTEDKIGIKAIYARQRAHGFIPYVATRELDRIVPEPE